MILIKYIDDKLINNSINHLNESNISIFNYNYLINIFK
jgi:hypothetical protein